MKKISILITLVLMFVTLVECQNKTTNSSAPQESSKYQGQWASILAEDLGNGTFGKRVFDLDKDQWEIQFTLYLDSTLTVPVFQFRGMGTYQIQGKSTMVEGADNALFLFERKFMTLFNDDPKLVESFGFGPCNLKIDVEQEITKDGCSFLVSKDICGQEYDLIKLAGGNLYFGMRPADGNMCTEDKRPTALFYPLTNVNK